MNTKPFLYALISLSMLGCQPNGTSGSPEDVVPTPVTPVTTTYSATYAYPDVSLNPGDGAIEVAPIGILECKDASTGVVVDLTLCDQDLAATPKKVIQSPQGERQIPGDPVCLHDSQYKAEAPVGYTGFVTPGCYYVNDNRQRMSRVDDETYLRPGFAYLYCLTGQDEASCARQSYNAGFSPPTNLPTLSACEGTYIFTKELTSCVAFAGVLSLGITDLSRCANEPVPPHLVLSPSGQSIQSVPHGRATYTCSAGQTMDSSTDISLSCFAGFAESDGSCISQATTLSSVSGRMLGMINGQIVVVKQTDGESDSIYAIDKLSGVETFLATLDPGSGDTSILASYSGAKTQLSSGIVFSVVTTTGQTQLWTSNGTPEGTMSLSHSWPNGITPLANGIGLFVVNQSEVWKTDGTVAGTSLIKNAASEIGANIDLFESGGNVGYLTATSPTLGAVLYVSDGTSEGTRILRSYPKLNPADSVSFGNSRFDADDGSLLIRRRYYVSETQETTNPTYRINLSTGTEELLLSDLEKQPEWGARASIKLSNGKYLVSINGAFAITDLTDTGTRVFSPSVAPAGGFASLPGGKALVNIQGQLYIFDETTELLQAFHPSEGISQAYTIKELSDGRVLLGAYAHGTQQIVITDGSDEGTYSITGFESLQTNSQFSDIEIDEQAGEIYIRLQNPRTILKIDIPSL